MIFDFTHFFKEEHQSDKNITIENETKEILVRNCIKSQGKNSHANCVPKFLSILIFKQKSLHIEGG